MSHYYSHIQTALSLVEAYKGKEPFAVFIKKYFAANKKYGSRDRKTIAHYCYCFYRWGKAWEGKPSEDKLLAGVWLCHTATPDVISSLRPQWITALLEKGINPEQSSMEDRLMVIGQPAYNTVFPWVEALSEGIDPRQFTHSFFIQPDLYLRVRPGKMNMILQRLQSAGLESRKAGEDCLALTNSSSIEKIIETDKEAVIQDLSSQKVIRFFKELPLKKQRQVWDACAASGGKSILLYDFDPSVRLTVSDIRISVLKNLEIRFHAAGIRNFRSFVADLSDPGRPIPEDKYDLVIADVPCSGSGTWSRTPEQLVFFDYSRLEEFASLQKKIITRLLPAVLPGGYFLYITCSVFRQENEEQVEFIENNYPVRCIKKETIIGYDKKADTMFAALFVISGS